MLIKPAPDIRSSEITDELLYLRRREFLQAAAVPVVAAAAAAIAPAALAAAPQDDPLPNVRKGVVTRQRAVDAVRGRHDLQQLLRVRHGQGRPVPQRRQLPDAARGR